MAAERTGPDPGADGAHSMVVTTLGAGELMFYGPYLPTPERQGNGPPPPGPEPVDDEEWVAGGSLYKPPRE